MTQQIRQVVVQPTSACNLNCSYCYLPNRRDKSVMTDAILEATLSKILQSNLVQNDVEFLWHAGEPLMVGTGFYENSMRLIRKHNTRNVFVRNSIQTNGMLIDDAWCRFFSDHNFFVGVSIDGPAFLHDSERVNWSGRASHQSVMRGYNSLRSFGLSPGVLCVLTRASLRYPEEIFSFFLEHDCELLCFNIEEIEDINTSSSFTRGLELSKSTIIKEYGEFMSRIYDLWRPNAGRMVIREFRDMFSTFYNVGRNSTHFSRPLETVELGIITVQKNGDITAFSPEFAGAISAEYGNFVVGNILHDPLEAIPRHPIFLRLDQDIKEGVRNCRETCGYFPVCGGGFTSNKYFENNSLTSTETTTCVLHRQALASVLLDKLACASTH